MKETSNTTIIMKVSYFLRITVFSILWFSLTLKVCAQSQTPADSIFSVLDKNPGDERAFSELDKIISGLFYTNADLALELAEKELIYARKSENYLASCKAILNVGIVNDLKGNYTVALEKYEEALELAKINNLTDIQGDIYNNFSITHAVLGNMEESISCALKSLGIFEKLNDTSRMARIYNNLGSRYSEIGYFNEALDYYLKAVNINEKAGENKKLAFNFGNIGLLYYEQNQNEKALEYFEKSLRLQDTLNDKYNFSIALHNMALAYTRLSKFEIALKCEYRSLAIASEINDELGRITSTNGLAAIHRDMGRKGEALKYYHQSEFMAEKIGARYYLINIYEKIADIYAEVKDYENAFLYNQKFTALKDSIMTTEKDKAVQKIKNFESEKKQIEIQLLTKDSEIQKLSIKRQKIIRNSVMVVGILILILTILLFHRYRYVRKTRNELTEKNIIINREKERSDELLLNILPAQTALELKNEGHSKARHFDMVTVMFTDFKGFTYLAEILSAQELVDEIDHCFKKFDEIISRHGIEKIKTIGDAYMCAGGLPVANDTNPVDVVKAALEIQQFMREMNRRKKAENKPFFELRLGINTGPVVAGIVGTKKFQYDIWGDTVNTASRMESSGEVCKVNISQNTYEKVKHVFNCEYRGKIEAKNKGAIDMYFVEGLLE